MHYFFLLLTDGIIPVSFSPDDSRFRVREGNILKRRAWNRNGSGVASIGEYDKTVHDII